jgi:hypothetical protein
MLYVRDVNELVFHEFNGCVASGPFAGMKYIRRASSSTLAPKILGTYEKELHNVLEQAIRRRYDRILVVGCAEGYYAVGLALRLPGARIFAYDIDMEALQNLEELASLNLVQSRIVRCRVCDHQEFSRHASHRCFLICDIEGAEEDLLRPDLAPALVHFDILVEIHDGTESRRIHDALERRFERTHRLTFLRFVSRTLSDCAAVKSVVRSKNRLIAVDEMRTYGIEWGFFEALGHHGNV